MDSNEIIDFEGTMQTPNNGGSPNPVQEDTTNLSGKQETENITGKDNTNQEEPKTEPKTETTKTVEEKKYDFTDFEYNGKKYTRTESGEILDSDGNTFKTADEADAFLDSLMEDQEEGAKPEGDYDVAAISKLVGVELLDDNNNPVEFTNDVEGLTAYIKSVIKLQTETAEEAALNKFFEENPYSRDFANYVAINGSPAGFDTMRDSRQITIDPNNKMQQRDIIKYAAEMFGNKAISDTYLDYLEQTGNLYDESKAQLQAVIAQEEEERQARAREVQKQREAEEAMQEEGWKNIKKMIDSKQIGQYKLPDVVIRNINGKKIKGDLNDFYNYLHTPETVGNKRLTRYGQDLEKMTATQRTENNILEAWLLYTGGSYKDLVAMAINEEKVKRLVAKSKAVNTKSIPRFKDKTTGRVPDSDIIFE